MIFGVNVVLSNSLLIARAPALCRSRGVGKAALLLQGEADIAVVLQLVSEASVPGQDHSAEALDRRRLVHAVRMMRGVSRATVIQ